MSSAAISSSKAPVAGTMGGKPVLSMLTDEFITIVGPNKLSREIRKRVLRIVESTVNSHFEHKFQKTKTAPAPTTASPPLRIQLVPYGSLVSKTYLFDADVDLAIILTEPNNNATAMTTTSENSNSENNNSSSSYRRCLCVDAGLINTYMESLRQEFIATYGLANHHTNGAVPSSPALMIVESAEIIHSSSSKGNVSASAIIGSGESVLKIVFRNKIVVDITVNRLAGLQKNALIELLDLGHGCDHLFKRSIILAKAWLYHEAHLLGSARGLFSSYAIECMMANLFYYHARTGGGSPHFFENPLQVLYAFLTYYSSEFDFDNYAVTICGPIHMDDLQALICDNGKFHRAATLLDIHKLADTYTTTTTMTAGSVGWLSKFWSLTDDESYTIPSHQFIKLDKRLVNIIDPLDARNNLGKSVSIHCYNRVKGAFALGAKTVSNILDNNISQQLRYVATIFPRYNLHGFFLYIGLLAMLANQSTNYSMTYSKTSCSRQPTPYSQSIDLMVQLVNPLNCKCDTLISLLS